LTVIGRLIGRFGRLAGMVEIAHHDGVEALIDRLEAPNDVFQQFERRDLALSQGGDQLRRAAEAQSRWPGRRRGLRQSPIGRGASQTGAGNEGRTTTEQDIAAARAHLRSRHGQSPRLESCSKGSRVAAGAAGLGCALFWTATRLPQ
jgi:hypothetical protein